MFVEGERYSRQKDIHARFGGQQQGGISTPSEHPFVFIFTGKAGEQHGYEDGWKDEGVFLYTGEGQEGDMQFVRGNLAIRDHTENGKEILLFQALGKSQPVLFKGRFACNSWDRFQALDRNNQDRSAIRFHLVKLPSKEDIAGAEEVTFPIADLDELRRKAFQAARSRQSPQWSTAPREYRKRAKAVRDYVLARSGGKCELSGKDAPFLTPSGAPYLEIHHTRRLSDDGPDDPRYVAAICPTLHREIHYGKHGKHLNEQLTAKLQKLEKS